MLLCLSHPNVCEQAPPRSSPVTTMTIKCNIENPIMNGTNEMNGNKGTQASTERFGKAHTFHVLFSSRPFLFFTLRATHRLRCMRIRVCTSRESMGCESHPSHPCPVASALLASCSRTWRVKWGIQKNFVCLSPDLPY